MHGQILFPFLFIVMEIVLPAATKNINQKVVWPREHTREAVHVSSGVAITLQYYTAKNYMTS